MKKMTGLIGKILLSVFLMPLAAYASHFRGGDINWTVPDLANAPNTVRFVVTQSWHDTSLDCWSLIDVTGGSYNYIPNTCYNDTTGDPNVVDIGTGVDAAGKGYVTRQYVVSYTFPGPGIYTVGTPNCCRVSDLQNGADENANLYTQVVLDGKQKGNPVSAIPPVITFSAGAVRTFTIPMFDPDGDALSCRFATTEESGVSNPVPVAGGQSPTISYAGNSCVVTWDLTSATPPTSHVLPIVVEARDNTGVVNTLQLDSMAVVTDKLAPTCTGGGQIALRPGQNYSTAFQGVGASELTLNVIGAPATSIFSPASGASGASPLTTNFSWTPTQSDSGTSVAFRVIFRDADFMESSCTQIINVDATNPSVTLDQPDDVFVGTAPSFQGLLTDAVAGQTVQLDISDGNGGSWTVMGVVSGEGYSAKGPADLPAGPYSVTVSLPGTSVQTVTQNFNVLPAVQPIQPTAVPAIGSIALMLSSFCVLGIAYLRRRLK
ncbi:hypothetical protein [Comamonas sediminis]|uniref:IPTL-CTERM sorting domain-containing protein n=1 Tax=Comamonas sediminis TaxID=1783360 RepID=A0ABV4AY78_9BURK